MEQKFFFLYHLHMDERKVMRLPINERRWMMSRWLKQKERENEAIEAARRNKGNKRR